MGETLELGQMVEHVPRERRDAAHQRRLARAVGPEQPEHAVRNRQRDVAERAGAIRVRLRDGFKLEIHRALARARIVAGSSGEEQKNQDFKAAVTKKQAGLTVCLCP